MFLFATIQIKSIKINKVYFAKFCLQYINPFAVKTIFCFNVFFFIIRSTDFAQM